TPAVKTFVDAFITIEKTASNNVGQPHTFTVTVMQNDGQKPPAGDPYDGFGAATSGHVDVTLTNGGGAVAVIDKSATNTCLNSGNNLDSNGQCTITFTSATPGTVTGHATVTLTISGATGSAQVTRVTDGIAPNSGDAVKTFLAGSIKWTKVSNDGT